MPTHTLVLLLIAALVLVGLYYPKEPPRKRRTP